MPIDTFDLSDVTEEPLTTPTATDDSVAELRQWADEQLAVNNPMMAVNNPMIYDIETGPRPEEELRAVYHEKTADEFAETCDKRWKTDTVAAKYEEYKLTAWQDFVDKAALSPMTGRVLLLGMLKVGNEEADSLYIDDEKEMLIEFWDRCETILGRKQPMIGHNSANFDMPFLVRRSWILGVTVPSIIRQGRYWNPLFRDTMEWWQCGGRDYAKLNDLGACLGVGQKTEGIEGKDFSRFWFGQMDTAKYGTPKQQRALAFEYNVQDMRVTAEVAAKMGMF